MAALYTRARLDAGVVETWAVGGRLHRCHEEGPALVNTFDGGGSTCAYFWENEMHRPPEAGPAFVLRAASGVALKEKYIVDGLYHRPPQAGPAIVKRSESGVVLKEKYRVMGLLHRPQEEGPAVIRRDKRGNVVEEAYYYHGTLIRREEEGPAVIHYSASGVVVEEFYYGLMRDHVHRSSEVGPAHTRRNEAGVVLEENYIEFRVSIGESALHRELGPACIRRDDSGEIVETVHYLDGMLHREDGPAVTYTESYGTRVGYFLWDRLTRDEDEGPAMVNITSNGVVNEEVYYRDGLMHRSAEKGPACIRRSEDTGEVTDSKFYLDGQEVDVNNPVTRWSRRVAAIFFFHHLWTTRQGKPEEALRGLGRCLALRRFCRTAPIPRAGKLVTAVEPFGQAVVSFL